MISYYKVMLKDTDINVKFLNCSDIDEAISQACDLLKAKPLNDNTIATPLLTYEIQPISFKNKLQYYKYINDLSTYEISKLTGISEDMLKHYLGGSLQLINAKVLTVYKLSKALGCEIEDLLD